MRPVCSKSPCVHKAGAYARLLNNLQPSPQLNETEVETLLGFAVRALTTEPTI